MLEHQALWLGPWSSAGQALGDGSPSRPHRPILDLATREFLGLARWRPTTVTTWFGCLTRPTVEVYETEDESLLFTLARTWGLGDGWLVRDADGYRIGTLRGALARDRFGYRLAVENASESQAGRWLTPNGLELGTFGPAADGLQVAFNGVDGNPFLKMLLLATLLRSMGAS